MGARSGQSELPLQQPGTATGITTDDVHRQDLSKLTPDAVAAYQARWKSLFQG